jgi:hypothetical protein
MSSPPETAQFRPKTNRECRTRVQNFFNATLGGLRCQTYICLAALKALLGIRIPSAHLSPFDA